VQDGYRTVVDVDLEKFFGRGSHVILLERLSKQIKDKVVLRLILRYLEAGMTDDRGHGASRRYATRRPDVALLINVLLDAVEWD